MVKGQNFLKGVRLEDQSEAFRPFRAPEKSVDTSLDFLGNPQPRYLQSCSSASKSSLSLQRRPSYVS